MARYIVERNFSDGLNVPTTHEGAQGCARIIAVNGEQDVTWVNSFVSLDKKKTYCVYDAPSPEAIRQVARRNNLPVETITEVTVLDPYFYH